MRLDKFLKNARLLKQRSAAKAEAVGGRVLVNEHPAKPGREVRVGDRITLLPDEPERSTSAPTYEILSEPLRPIPKGEEGAFYRLTSAASSPKADRP